jgi:signal transduction histidine kinase
LTHDRPAAALNDNQAHTADNTFKTKPATMSPQSITAKLRKTSTDLLSRLLSKPVILKRIFQQPPSRFIAALIHEIRNPLTTINLAVTMFQRAKNTDEQKKYAEMITRASHRINELVNNLLITQKNDDIKPNETSAQELLEDILTIVEDRIILKNISVRKKFSQDDCRIFIDKQKIKIAITNIIINAIDAMPDKSGELELVLNTESGKCIIEIADNGIGISKDNLHHIFEPYFTKKQSGMGLGLSASMEILSANHAAVIVQSEEGLGTRFILSFKSVKMNSPVLPGKIITNHDFFIF